MAMVPWLNGFSDHRAKEASSIKINNFYLEIIDSEDAKERVIAIGTPGTMIWQDCADLGASGESRGWYKTSDGQVLVAIGESVWRLTYDRESNIKSLFLVVDVGSGASQCEFADNGLTCIFTINSSAYAYDLNTKVVQTMQSLPFLYTIGVKYIGNRFVMICEDDNYGDTTKPAKIARNNNKFFWSDAGANGWSAWDATSFETTKTNSDPVIGMAVRLGELWLYGKGSFEVWRPTGDDDAPFAFAGGSSSEIGCVDSRSIQCIADQIFWVGSSNIGARAIFVSGNGYEAKRISNQATEYQIAKAETAIDTEISDWQGVCYSEETHLFYIVSSRDAQKTFAYDLTNGKWHTRSTTSSGGEVQERWEVNYCMYAFGKLLVMDYSNPYIMEMSLNLYRDYIPVDDELGGRSIVSYIQGPVWWNGLAPFIADEFIIDMETGVGSPVIGYQGENPKAMMNLSRDGGNTFGADRWTKIGRTGEFARMVRWSQLGESRSLVIRVTISDPIRKVLLGASLFTLSSSSR